MTNSEGTLGKRMTLDSCGDISLFCERVNDINDYSDGHRKKSLSIPITQFHTNTV
ncbi:MAG: hypothetical protein HZR80_13710 [Candidatus Heimdallarchaeota archaeon]